MSWAGNELSFFPVSPSQSRHGNDGGLAECAGKRRTAPADPWQLVGSALPFPRNWNV